MGWEVSRDAVARASLLLDELQIRHPREIDIDLIAASCKALVCYRSLASQEGHLIRYGRTGLIVVHCDAQRSQKWRFVIAHELGHLLCHEDIDQSYLCTRADLHAYRTSGYEGEANDFAAELLMPRRFFQPYCKDLRRPSLHEVRRLADEFNTSLSSTAVRLAGLVPVHCVAIRSEHGLIAWWWPSEDFPFTLRKGFRVTTDTYAGDIFAGNRVDDRPQLVPGDAWSDDSRASSWELYEHSMQIGQYGVLTLLSCPSR